jgi:hypothetical protein
MNVRRDGHAGVKFAEHRDAAGLFVFMEREQLDPRIRSGLPRFVFGQGHVREHWTNRTQPPRNCKRGLPQRGTKEHKKFL